MDSEPRLPAGFEMPVRENYAGHQCRCELVHMRIEALLPDGREITRTVKDSCGMQIADPEQPVCDSCVNAGHTLLPEFHARESERRNG